MGKKQMNVKEKIKTYIQEAELYQSQGLLIEAKEAYVNAGKLIKKYLKNEKLLRGISKKIHQVKKEIERFESLPTLTEVSEEVQEVIKKQFAFSEDEDMNALEGAIALAKFGQYKRAFEEFNQLMARESIRLDAAKNICRCYLAVDEYEKAALQYEQWVSEIKFNPDEAESIRLLLQTVFDRKGFERQLTRPDQEEEKSLPQGDNMPDGEGAKEIFEAFDTPIFDSEQSQTQPGLVFDITSVGIMMEEGDDKGNIIEYDVSFQSGNILNLLIPETDKEKIAILNPGVELKEVQFFSSIAMFNGKAVVSNKSVIEKGPKKGNYSLDLEIKSI